EVLRRAPLVAPRRAVHELDRDEAGTSGLRSRAGPTAAGGHHGVQQRKRDGRAHPLEEGPALEALAGEEMHDRSPFVSSPRRRSRRPPAAGGTRRYGPRRG